MKFLLILAACAFCASCSSMHKKAGDTKTQAAAHTKNASSQTGAMVTCTKGKETRTLEVVSENKGCKLDYTKSGKVTTPATSVHGDSWCKKVEAKIEKNLASAGYNCQ